MTRIVHREFNPVVANRLIQEGFLPPIARALAARGIEQSSELAVDWRSMVPPNRLDGTREAAVRLAKARADGERVTIVADYDCDGATACAVGLRGLSMLGLNVDYFVPDRVVHGYGLTNTVVDIVAGRRPKPGLIVTVDNGISSIEAVERAKALGIDVIITDHHLPGAVEPDAVCIVNPNKRGCSFPSKSLAGVGVMYYVLLALRAYLRETGVYTRENQPRLDTLVDLVALGTVADVVRLDQNNRILVAQGLQRLRQGHTHPGLAALFTVAGKDLLRASVRDFGFAIGPRINAAGRLSSMECGIECLLSNDPGNALELARSLNEINSERRELEVEMQHAAENAVNALDLENRTTVTLFDESFNEGVVGLVASRIKEKIHRPVIAFAPTDTGMLKGSGRSIAGIHLRDVLDLVNKALPGSIERFGGHAMAAGLTLRPEALADFTRVFEDIVRAGTPEDAFEHVVYTDGGLAPDEINEGLILSMNQQIWGQGFDLPIFSNEFKIVRQSLIKDTHLKMIVELGGQRFDAIFFRHADALPATVKLAYRPGINEYMGRRSVQLVIEAAQF